MPDGIQRRRRGGSRQVEIEGRKPAQYFFAAEDGTIWAGAEHRLQNADPRGQIRHGAAAVRTDHTNIAETLLGSGQDHVGGHTGRVEHELQDGDVDTHTYLFAADRGRRMHE